MSSSASTPISGSAIAATAARSKKTHDEGRSMTTRTKWIGVAVILVLAATGCTKTPQITTVPVSGRVTYKGQPVVGALVTFDAEGSTGKPANGRTDGDGKYKLTTIVSGAITQDGAVPGNYNVGISKKSGGTAAPTNLSTQGVQNMSMEEKMKLGGGNLSRPASGTAPAGDEAAAKSASGEISDIPERYATPSKSSLVATVPSQVAAGSTFTADFELKD
jgi:hypothetical protein